MTRFTEVSNKKIIWSQNYHVNSFLVNSQKMLGLYGLLNLLQDVAWIHAAHLGHGFESMLRDDTGWVLTRQKLWMQRWPLWDDDLEFRTWIRPIEGPLIIRDFEMLLRGEVIGQCTTQWLLFDLKTRRPSTMSSERLIHEVRTDFFESIEAKKILPLINPIKLFEFKVRNSDLDMNGHVNNTRYAQWILDSIPLEKHAEYALNGYEINFLSETKLNDTIEIKNKLISDELIQFQGVRVHDQKLVFVANLNVSLHPRIYG